LLELASLLISVVALCALLEDSLVKSALNFSNQVGVLPRKVESQGLAEEWVAPQRFNGLLCRLRVVHYDVGLAALPNIFLRVDFVDLAIVRKKLEKRIFQFDELHFFR